jgi:16S rRNA (cytosine967-C5)-methyltransferase
VVTAVGRGLRLDVAFPRAAAGLEPRDRGFVHELVYGALRLRGRLDHLLEQQVHGGLERLDPTVLQLLRLGAYQLLYMDGVPAYAAVSQTVAQVRREAGRGAGGLVNAVLRAAMRAGAGAERFPDFGTDPAGWLERWGSHPAWMVERWLRRWTAEEVRALVESDNARPATWLVPLDRDAAAAVATLAGVGIAVEAIAGDVGCVRLAAGTDPAEALAALPSIVQDPGAHLVARYADPAPGARIADLCAAPGGKALALSVRASYTLAADRSEARMRRIRDNALRTGRPLGLVVADAAHPPLRDADVVVVDVPCTGTGTLGRHPDGRWRLGPDSVDTMIPVQRAILDGAAGAVRPGGLLVYATCSLEPEENEEQVSAFLARRADFRLERTRAVREEYLDEAGRLVVLPWRTGFDGAFAARLRRAA